ncbi:hypothetical protein PQX77_020540 [Marasmius sp. AFHP31]|nr:hypothetical protein PQX77_020540 [Marasmius sp. AFHP31]
MKGTTALFDETLYPRCPDVKTRGVTPVDGERFTLSENLNIPLEDNDSDDSSNDAPSRNLGSRPRNLQKRPEPPVDEPAGSPKQAEEPLPPSGPPLPTGEADIPVPPPQPAAEGPRRSSRLRTGTTQPGSIFGEKRNPNKPSQIVCDLENKKSWRKITGDIAPSHKVDHPGSSKSRKGKGGKKGVIPGPLPPPPAPEPSGSTESQKGGESVVE